MKTVEERSESGEGKKRKEEIRWEDIRDTFESGKK